MAALRVAKICVLLDGNATEAGQGLAVLKEELAAEGGEALLQAFLNASPQLAEVTKLLECSKNQHDAFTTLAQATRVKCEDGRLFHVMHSIVTEHLSLLNLWLAGERGQRACVSALEFLTAINIYAHALLRHRLKLKVKGPWIGPEVAWKKKKKLAYDRQLREAGLRFLLSFVECKDDNGCEVAVGCHGFMQAMCSTLDNDSEETRNRVAKGITVCMLNTSVQRSKRAYSLERKGVLDALVHAAADAPFVEDCLVSGIIPALSVPEVPYQVDAKVIPNQVLFFALKSCAPHKHPAHRRITRSVLLYAPSLAVPYLEYLKERIDILPFTQRNASSADLLFALDVIFTVLEAPLPASLTKGSLRMDGDGDGSDRKEPGPSPAGSGRTTFDLTPSSVADVVLPHFVGQALSLLLKNDTDLIVFQALQLVVQALKRHRAVENCVAAVAERQELLANDPGIGGRGGGGPVSAGAFMRAVRHKLSARLPKAGAVLRVHEVLLARLEAAGGGAAAGPAGPAFLFKYERFLLALRLLQLELPGHLAGAGLLKVFPARRLLAPPASGGAGSFAGLSASAALLLLQLLANDAGMRTSAMFAAAPPAGKLPPPAQQAQPNPVLDAILLHAALREEGSEATIFDKPVDPVAGEVLREACVALVASVVANSIIEPAFDPIAVSEVDSWLHAVQGPADAAFLCDVLRGLNNDVLSLRDPFNEANRRPGSPLLRVATREVEKRAAKSDAVAVAGFVARFEAHLRGKGGAAPAAENEAFFRRLAPAVPRGYGLFAAIDAGSAGVERKTAAEIFAGKKADTPLPIESGSAGDASADGELIRRYTGTLGAADQALWPAVKKLLPQWQYQAGPTAPLEPKPADVLWTQSLANSLTFQKISNTLLKYPVEISAFPDDPTLVDPRYVVLVLAAHLALCASRDPPTVPEIRRLCLQGLIPLVIKTLSSFDEKLRVLAYTALAALYQVTPDASPFAVLLQHVKNSCWAPRCRLPNTVSTLLASCCDAVFRPGQPIHQAVAKYLTKYPFTRRKDLPFSSSIISPVESTTAQQQFCLQVALGSILSMTSANCKSSIEALVQSGLLSGCLTALRSPLTPDNVREQAVKVLEAAAGVLPTVLIVRLRMSIALANAALTLRPSATGDLRTVVQRRNWEVRARLVSTICIAILNLPDTFELKPHVYEFSNTRDVLMTLVNRLGEEVTSDASTLFTSAVLAIRLLTSKLPRILAVSCPAGFAEKLALLQKVHALSGHALPPAHLGDLIALFTPEPPQAGNPATLAHAAARVAAARQRKKKKADASSGRGVVGSPPVAPQDAVRRKQRKLRSEESAAGAGEASAAVGGRGASSEPKKEKRKRSPSVANGAATTEAAAAAAKKVKKAKKRAQGE
ncbi:hypothetical protein DIPPA_07490 [Diplonema papillatum]|nr:hypothetical protein DIPPA_07490 [Diplonema papillatum]